MEAQKSTDMIIATFSSIYFTLSNSTWAYHNPYPNLQALLST